MSIQESVREIYGAKTMSKALDVACDCCARCMHPCKGVDCGVEKAVMNRGEKGMTKEEKKRYFDFVGDR